MQSTKLEMMDAEIAKKCDLHDNELDRIEESKPRDTHTWKKQSVEPVE